MPIAKALVDVYKRGVKVQVILDKSQRTEKYSSATFLNNAGIRTFIDGKHQIAHNKVMVIDGRVVITGLFNVTKAAEGSNAENLLVIRDAQLLQSTRRTGRLTLATQSAATAAASSQQDPGARPIPRLRYMVIPILSGNCCMNTIADILNSRRRA